MLNYVTRAGVALCLWLMFSQVAAPYSVLSHEAMIDVLWVSALTPLLLSRYPGATPEQLKEARSYAYGGSILQDIGFYPHGNGYFSDLTHYARTGTFIQALLADAQTLNELAFALGGLSHYAGDCDGHRVGTNVGEPQLYPRLEKKFGNFITYEEDKSKHVKTEFGFDVLQVARGNYAPEAYHDFIGFNVATPLLERAFRETYGFEMKAMFKDLPVAIGSYRRTVSNLVPLATRVAWAQHQNEIKNSRPAMVRRQFVFRMSRSKYERDWGRKYDRPSAADRILAFFIKVLPPIGPLSALRFKAFTPTVEGDFLHSFDVAVVQYRKQVGEVGSRNLKLEDPNFDTGSITPPTKYGLQDETYAYWLDQLTHSHFKDLTPAVRDAVLGYYADLTLPFATKKNTKNWRSLLVQLSQLRSAPVERLEQGK